MVRLFLTGAGQAAVERADEAYAAWFGSLLDHTGSRAEILTDLLLLDEAMTERRRARLAADACAGDARTTEAAKTTEAANSTQSADTSAGQR